jgi:hypothetical protein
MRPARVPDRSVIFFKAAGPAVGGVGMGPLKVFSPEGGHLQAVSRILQRTTVILAIGRT